MKKGFTLIETVIYIALFTILMVSIFVTSYQLLQGSEVLNTKTVTQEEINFVMRKINWALTGTSSLAVIITPNAVTPYSNSLSLKQSDGTRIDIQRSDTKITMTRNSGTPDPITTDNVQVSSLSFHYLSPIGGNAPFGIEATTTINGLVATTTKYIRK